MNTTTTINVSQAAATAESVLEAVMKVEPTIATAASIFGGPAAAAAVGIIQPEVLFLVPFIENALKAVAAGNGGDAVDAVVQIAKHLLPGHSNAIALGPAPPAAPTISVTTISTQAPTGG